jgi:hypothetical protein
MKSARNSKGPPGEDGRLLQGKDHIEVFVNVPYSGADPTQRRLWDEVWGWLLSPIEEPRKRQGEESMKESYRPQLPRGGSESTVQRRDHGASTEESLDDNPHNDPTSSNMD